MYRTVALGVLLTALAGCGIVSDRLNPFSRTGQSAAALPFRANLEAGEDRRDIAITVRAADATVEDVRESARFPATRYCLERFGGSPVDWEIDGETGDWAVVRTPETMSFNGRCTAR